MYCSSNWNEYMYELCKEIPRCLYLGELGASRYEMEVKVCQAWDFPSQCSPSSFQVSIKGIVREGKPRPLGSDQKNVKLSNAESGKTMQPTKRLRINTRMRRRSV